MLWKRRTERCAGAALALRDRWACYAELLREGGRARLVNAEKIPLPDGLVSRGHLADGAALGAFLRKKLAFRWGRIPFAVGIPSADCIFRLFALPAANVEEARASMTWCFSDYFPFDVGEALFDVCEVSSPSHDGRLRLVGAACAKAQVAPFLESLRGPRARVFAAEPQIVAATRAFGSAIAEENFLLVMKREDSLHCAFVSAGSGLFFRSVALSAEEFAWSSQVCSEINRTLDYVSENFGGTAPPVYIAKGASAPVALPLGDLHAAAREIDFDGLCPAVLTPPADSEWYDVVGLLLRFDHED
ncbi:hypothetical protein FYJ74_04275 [Pyramidobacter sp. SM-530-WT-4B]|uniref:Pilus assembly protein PilM n=1 Tax=Pyramidobacter porci TaxID=2605789 RepID=A0A6L5YAU0_9BACT|nr:hypothetical protein [Pyramidobacter porci]MCI6260419.1 hypothetical protein [Pyramidobacter sp.]MST55255.1 hypothetical protein [Pyramidobacter porci]